MADIAWREPEDFAAGDTLVFQRSLPGYLPADGWHLHYTLTDPTTGLLVAEFDSVTSTIDSAAHLVSVDDFAATLDAKDYVLVGRAVNTASGEQHQVYYGELTLQENLAGGTASQPVLTEAQEMIALLRDTLKSLYKLQFSETEVQRNRFKIQDQRQVLRDKMYWEEMRRQEIAQERAKNGQPTGFVSVPVFAIG